VFAEHFDCISLIESCH